MCGRGYSIPEERKISYKWQINNFVNVLKYYENKENDNSLFSPFFSPALYDTNEFRLRLIFNSYKDPYGDRLSLYLCWHEQDQPIKLKITFYILNYLNEKCHVFNVTKMFEGKSTYWGIINYYRKIRFFHNTEGLLPDGILTLGCDLVVYEEPINIKLIYSSQYSFPIRDHFKQLLESQNDSDFIFNVNNRKFKVHKLILMTRSPVFAAMFRHKMTEKETNQAVITDIHPDIFDIMLKFIYTEEIDEENLNMMEIMEVLKAADKYQLNDLKEVCGELLYILLEVENTMEVFDFAEQYNVEELVSKVKDFIKANKKEILKTIDPERLINYGHLANIFI